MDSAQHIVKLKPDRRRAGRPHHDRAGARQSRLPAGDRARPDRPARGHPAGRVRRRGARGAAARSAAPRRADGRSRPARQRGRDARAPAAGRAVGSAQGRAQHHDVDEGRRKTRVLHRGLRRAAGASGGLHAAPDRRLHQARHQGHVVRPRLGRHACTCGRSSTCAARARRRCARSPRRPRRWCASTRAPSRASTATAWCARNGWPGSSGRGSPRRSGEVKDLFDPEGLLNPGKIVRPTKMDDRSLFRFKPGYKNISYKPALDWSAWNVQNDPMTEALTRARHRRRSDRRLRQGRRDVQQQRPLPQVRRRHDVPVLPRHARREASDARPRQHAAARAVRPARSRRAHLRRRRRARWISA